MGLDASTTTVGIAVVEYNGKKPKLIHQEYYKPNKKLPELQWLYETKEHVCYVADIYNVDEFAIEEYIKYMKGGSGASTIIPLAILNRTICLNIYELYHKEPVILNVMKIRHCLKTNKKLPSKEDMPELVAKHLRIKFPYYKKTIKKTGKQKILSESNDVADAIAVALAHIKLNHESK